MEKVYVSPPRYVQGRNVLKTGLHYIKRLGKSVLMLCDDVVYQIAGKELIKNLQKEGMIVTHIPFCGESSLSEIERISQLGTEANCDVIIGLGGGKTIDVAKAVGDTLNCSVAILPTTASTDAPTSAISVLYSKDGVFEKYRFYNKNPDLVLVDTEVICKAPVRLLLSGIADALATLVEGRVVGRSGGNTLAGGKQTLAAIAIAEKCEEVLFAYGIQAVEANRAKVVTPAFDAVVEANTLLSGIGFESCGLAGAHAIHNAFSVLTGEVHQLTHGEKVAYGTLTQLFLENRPKEELDRFIAFYQVLGLPTTLQEMHLETATYEELLKVGKQAVIKEESMHNIPNITAQDVADAMLAVDAYVRAQK